MPRYSGSGNFGYKLSGAGTQGPWCPDILALEILNIKIAKFLSIYRINFNNPPSTNFPEGRLILRKLAEQVTNIVMIHDMSYSMIHEHK